MGNLSVTDGIMCFAFVSIISQPERRAEKEKIKTVELTNGVVNSSCKTVKKIDGPIMWIVYAGLKHIDNKHIVFPVISWLLKIVLNYLS